MLWKPTANSMAALVRWQRLLERAKAIDPDAFKAIMVPSFTPEQESRQTVALMKAREEE